MLFSKKTLIYASLALFASHVIASLGIPGSTLEVMRMKGYLYALLSGAAVAFGILYTLPMVTKILNKKFPWNSALIKRIISQLFLGIVLPFLAIMLLITVYFSIAGIWILGTGWLKHCSIAIVFMLFFVNLFNEILAELQGKNDPNETVRSVVPDVPEIKFFKGRPYSDVVYVTAGNGKNLIAFRDGTKFHYPKSIDFARTILPEDTHLLAKRGLIIELASIRNTKWLNGKRQRIQVFLKGHESFEVIFSETQTALHREVLTNFMGGIN
jgi:hypothetical protein